MTTKKAASPSAAEEAAPALEAIDAPSSPSSAEYTVAFSPRQVAVGLAIVAGLIAIAIRHRRSRDRRSADD
ncbi:MAG TPA: hypothetical protein VFY18_10185 [Candidatus Limnocylindrales bacterium]|nr:hypothetical protein [Candidatus Limnocylindrales bacterium]